MLDSWNESYVGLVNYAGFFELLVRGTSRMLGSWSDIPFARYLRIAKGRLLE